MNCSLPGSSVHGIFQERILKWVAISFSGGSSQPRDRTRVSHIVGRRFTFWAPREVLRPDYTTAHLSDSLQPHALYSPWLLQARILEWVAFHFARGSSQSGDQTQVSPIAGGFFTSWAKGKPKNIGVGSLSLLQQIFLTQECEPGSPTLQTSSLPSKSVKAKWMWGDGK